MTRKILFVFLLTLAPTVFGDNLATEDPPDTIYTSNVSIDLHNQLGTIWMATDEGVNFTTDNGLTWLRYDSKNGLMSNNISSIFSVGNRVWVASGHTGIVAGESVSLSDGLQYTDDSGDNWNLIDFDAFDIPYATGGERTIFDITGHADWVVASAFAGGLLVSRDAGLTWRRIFAKRADSINYYDGHLGLVEISLPNRQFSNSIDTSHFDPLTPWDDSIYLWTGTAGGLYKMIFADRHVKPQSGQVNDIAFCLDCGGSDSSYVFIGSDNGLSRGLANPWFVTINANPCWQVVHPRVHGGPYISRFSDDPGSFPHNSVTALIEYGGYLFIGTEDNQSGSAALSLSDNHGESVTGSTIWTGSPVTDFAVIEAGGRLYAASEDSIMVSSDTSLTFVSLVGYGGHALAVLEDTLLVGTDTGLVVLNLDPAGAVVTTTFEGFVENDSTASRIVDIELQQFFDTTGAILDSTIIWTVNQPNTIAGHPFVGRYHLDSIGTAAPWQRFLVDSLTNDLSVVGNEVFMGGGKGIWRFAAISSSTAFGGENNYFPVYSTLPGYVTDSLHLDTVTTVTTTDSIIYFGTHSGFALSLDAGTSFDIVRPNLDPLVPDSAQLYTVASSFLNCSGTAGLTGNWIPAMELQQFPNSADVVWVSSRSTGRGADTLGFGISRGVLDTLAWVADLNGVDSNAVTIRNFELFYDDGYAWNFAFHDSTVFAATNGGLIYNSTGEKMNWDTLRFVNDAGVEQILPGVAVYGVAVEGNWLWVATDDRAVRVDLTTLLVDKTFYVTDTDTPADEVYAFPVPYSHTSDYALDFHFTVEKDADITLEIYDFAMNLVRRVIDNQPYAAGIYPTSGTGRVVWDGKNGKGDDVAVGVYYFKVSYSTGQERWGKLAVMP
ncbi:MAG: FlgD immunoglobulin-like domain containing protein [bacterium]|nr:FlgD immunoglobulin-like domain containing protein [bacterium]